MKLTKLVSLLLALVLIVTYSTTLLAATPAPQGDQTIVEIAVEDGRFTTLVAALEAAELVETLNGEGPFTVFAPTDTAFEMLPEGTVEALLEDIPTLTNILLYHVVPGRFLAADVVNLTSADTALGEPVTITVDGSTVKVNDAQVIITDIEASNGVIHVIDAVLLPPDDESAEDAGATEDDASEDASEEGAEEGDEESSEDASEDASEEGAEDASEDASEEGADEGSEELSGEGAETAEDQTIVDIAVEDGRFTTLVAALQAAELVETLSGEGPFTVFAPTDDAFAKLPEGTVEGLLEDIPTLTNILLYHVVSGKVMAEDVVTLTTADTVLGESVNISVEDGTVKINDAQVIITDIEASNGVIHVIDTVLLPSETASAEAEADTEEDAEGEAGEDAAAEAAAEASEGDSGEAEVHPQAEVQQAAPQVNQPSKQGFYGVSPYYPPYPLYSNRYYRPYYPNRYYQPPRYYPRPCCYYRSPHRW